MTRRAAIVASLAAVLVLGVPTPAHGARMDNFRPSASLDTAQVWDAETSELAGLVAADESQLWRAVGLRFPESPAGAMDPITDVLVGRSGEILP